MMPSSWFFFPKKVRSNTILSNTIRKEKYINVVTNSQSCLQLQLSYIDMCIFLIVTILVYIFRKEISQGMCWNSQIFG